MCTVVEGITGLPGLPCLNTSAVCLKVFSDLAFGGKTQGSQETTLEEIRKKASGDPLKTCCDPKLEKRWVKRLDLVRTRHSGVAVNLKIFLEYITADPISPLIMYVSVLRCSDITEKQNKCLTVRSVEDIYICVSTCPLATININKLNVPYGWRVSQRPSQFVIHVVLFCRSTVISINISQLYPDSVAPLARADS